MCAHVFGGTSSPSCSNYALKRTAVDGETKFGKEAAETLQNNFYVDDLLKSVDDEDKAIKLIKEVKAMCASGGFRLTKFLCNSKKVLQSIPEDDRRAGVKDKDLVGKLPSENTLGVHWNTETDTFEFRINLKQKPLTRRGTLSLLSSVYDPLGFAAPFFIPGKLLIQQLCKGNLGWDEAIPENMQIQWGKWEKKLQLLDQISLDRCFKPINFGTVVESTLHHFSDASEYGYGQVSYLRLVDNTGRIHCSLVIGKARVAPLKCMTMPRMELVAATLSVKISVLLKKELQIPIKKEMFWTDSEVVLAYIRNEAKRFKIFVANRIELIKEHSDECQWFYVSSKQNPADHASRGIDICNQNKVQEWLLGPKFLWKPEEKWNVNRTYTQVNSDDPELKKDLVVSYMSATSDVLSALEMHVSYWSRMVRVVALVIRFKNNLVSAIKHKASNKTLNENQSLLDTSLMEEAKNIIIKMVQKRSFNVEFKWLKSMKDKTWGNKALGRRGKISRLDPFLDKDGIIRVGGRLDNCFINNNCKHPILLPKDGKVATLIIQHHHKMAAHGGSGITLNQVRSSGYWIVGANLAVKNFIYRCVDCERLRGRFGEQKMEDLPACRLTETAPFRHCGVDIFDPFIVKQRRSEVKRYGTMFTCMANRAVHIEVTFSLDTDSFILALRRLIARCGNV